MIQIVGSNVGDFPNLSPTRVREVEVRVICQGYLVVSKLKCPVLLASEVSGFGFTSFI